MGQYINGFYVFAPVTSTDHAGLLWVAAILSLLFSVVTLFTRYHIKRRAFGTDDWLITAATVLGVAQYIALFVGMQSYALGKSSALLTHDEASHAGQCVFASNCLFIAALALSKFSVVIFMKRLFTRDFHLAWLICNILIGVVAVWAVASMMILTIGCPASSKLEGARCTGQVIRWSVVAAFDGVFELAIILLSIVLVWPLQMSMEIKMTVVFAFVLRIFVAVFAGIHAARIARYAHLPDPGLNIIGNLIWQQIELGYALIAATIPTLKSFIRGYEKAMGWEVSYSKSHSGPAPGMFGTASIQMQSFRSKNSKNSNQNSGGRSQNREHSRLADEEDVDECSGAFRPDKSKYKANIYGPRQVEHGVKLKREPSTGSSDSQNPIIRKDVHFTVSSETAPPSPWNMLGSERD